MSRVVLKDTASHIAHFGIKLPTARDFFLVLLRSLASDFAHFPSSIRSHWGIENQLHWCLEVIFSEDNSRIRKDHAPRNMTILRRLALNLLRQDTSSGSLKMKRYQAGLNNNFLLQILSNSGIF